MTGKGTGSFTEERSVMVAYKILLRQVSFKVPVSIPIIMHITIPKLGLKGALKAFKEASQSQLKALQKLCKISSDWHLQAEDCMDKT